MVNSIPLPLFLGWAWIFLSLVCEYFPSPWVGWRFITCPPPPSFSSGLTNSLLVLNHTLRLGKGGGGTVWDTRQWYSQVSRQQSRCDSSFQTKLGRKLVQFPPRSISDKCVLKNLIPESLSLIFVQCVLLHIFFTCSVTRSDLLPEKHWEQVKKEVKTWRQNIKTVMWQWWPVNYDTYQQLDWYLPYRSR